EGDHQLLDGFPLAYQCVSEGGYICIWGLSAPLDVLAYLPHRWLREGTDVGGKRVEIGHVLNLSKECCGVSDRSQTVKVCAQRRRVESLGVSGVWIPRKRMGSGGLVTVATA